MKDKALSKSEINYANFKSKIKAEIQDYTGCSDDVLDRSEILIDKNYIKYSKREEVWNVIAEMCKIGFFSSDDILAGLQIAEKGMNK